MAIKCSVLVLLAFLGREVAAATALADDLDILSWNSTSNVLYATVSGNSAWTVSMTQFCIISDTDMTASSAKMEVWYYSGTALTNLRTDAAVTAGASTDARVLCGTMTGTAVGAKNLLVKVEGFKSTATGVLKAGAFDAVKANNETDVVAAPAVTSALHSVVCSIESGNTDKEAVVKFKSTASDTSASTSQGPVLRFWKTKTDKKVDIEVKVADTVAGLASATAATISTPVDVSTTALLPQVIINGVVQLKSTDQYIKITNKTADGTLAAAMIDSTTLLFCGGIPASGENYYMTTEPLAIGGGTAASSDFAVRSLGMIGAGLVAAVAMLLN